MEYQLVAWARPADQPAQAVFDSGLRWHFVVPLKVLVVRQNAAFTQCNFLVL